MEKLEQSEEIKHFKEALQQFLKCQSSEQLKTVEGQLEQFTENPSSIVEIIKILSFEDHPIPLTQLLSVLLKKSIMENYGKIDPEHQQQILQ